MGLMVGKMRHKMWGVSSKRLDHRYLANMLILGLLTISDGYHSCRELARSGRILAAFLVTVRNGNVAASGSKIPSFSSP
jgi:hypothetical protein